MATKTALTASKWDTAAPLPGLDLMDKGELVGKEFLITNVWFETNKRQVNYAYVDGEFRDGTAFNFNDSGTGVRAQLIAHLLKTNAIGSDDVPSDGTMFDVAILAPKGLRVSSFDVVDERGQTKKARTYYLTMSGQRAV